MDLSVIIPCHNLENYITPMLVSLRLQELEDAEVELLFVCDNCTDRTKEIIDKFEFGSQYKKISIIECDVRACGLARNVGLDRAEGKYIVFFDGDDWLVNAHALFSIVQIFYNRTNIKVFRFAYEAPGFPHIGHPSMVWQYAYTRSIIGDTRFTEIQPDEDLKFNQEICKKVNGMYLFYEEKLYHYNYLREGSNIHQLMTKGKIEP